ncbi:unnamed protein product, partial [Durusdinium trenchii]
VRRSTPNVDKNWSLSLRKSSSKIEKTEKDEDDTTAKKEEPDDEEGGDNQTDGDSEEADPENPEEADIRDVRHKLEKALAAKDRNLCVKNVTWVFDQASVYGKRDACVAGLAVVHRDKLNMFRGTSGWKHGLIRDVAMLPRSQMYKPEATTSTPHLGRAFTDAQELRQVAGGTDFVKKTLGTFLPDSVSTTLVIDLHCYDCWPALAALEECAAGRRLLCGSVVLDKQPDTMVQRIANKVYESCRAEQLKIVGFPSFAPLIQAIQQVKPDDQEKKYEVCVKKHDRLVVLQALAAKWMETEFKDETVAILEAHNKQFNVDGEYWHETERTTEADDLGSPLKRIKLEDSEIGKEADIANLQKPYIFQINNCAEMACGQDGAPLFLVSRGKNQFLMHRELFSFGSGDWRVNADATEIMADSCGRWFSFNVTLDTVMILEKKNLADHVASLPCVDSPTPLSTIIRQLEDAGE